MVKRRFIDLLKRQGYETTEKKLGGGFVNDVRLITAHKGDQVFEYVLKKYSSEKDVSATLRGYDAISSLVRTPTIVYQNGREVVYDLVKGKSIKDMIVEGDKEAPEAVRLLGKTLEKLHKSKNAPPKYRKGDSPDEKKMIKHVAKALETERIDKTDANRIITLIRKYIPKNKAIVHGDAHLGNFMYSDGQVYFIDPDNVKISDYNSDIGKVVSAIDLLGDEGKISASEASKLRELFLAEYNGEDPHAVEIYTLRTPLIIMKHRELEIIKKRVKKVLGGLEAKVASAVLFVVLAIVLLVNPNNFTGLVIRDTSTPNFFSITAIFIAGILIMYLVLKKREKK